MRPEGILFSKSHEWVLIEKDIATTGISDFAVKQLSDLVFVDLPEITDLLEQGQPYAEVESVKAVSDLYAPVTGQIVEVNPELADHPEYVNEDCYGDGWMIAIAVENLDEVDALLDAKGYLRHIEEREE